MSKVAQYLQEHVKGEVMTSKSARKYFSTDGGVFELMPMMVVYPRNVSDVRKVARFSWQLAERGKKLPITARGRGTDQAGAALGSGIMMVFPAHMKKIVELDITKGKVKIQPGINYQTLQQTLHTHGWFLPPYPSSIDYCTLGGAIANNAAGEKTIKYGATREYVEGLEIVLANGELVETGRLTRKQLEVKKGLTSFEGEIYRKIDALIDDNWDTIQNSRINVSKNSSGYDIADVKQSDGSFDLTPLIVGSQGTLAMITQATLTTAAYNPNATLFAAYFKDIHQADQAVQELLTTNPSALEMVDHNLLNFIDKHNPKQLEGLIEKPFPEVVLLVEYDDKSDRKQKSLAKKAKSILEEYAYEFNVTNNPDERDTLWKIRHSAAAVIWHTEGSKKALPIIEDGVVPQDKFKQYMKGIYKIFEKYNLDVALWGHAGNANLHMQPFLDLAKIGDRQKVFKIMNDYYGMVMKLGGSIAGEHSDGRLRAPYLKQLYGKEMYGLFTEVKNIFDPFEMLNPGVKMHVKQEDIMPLLRHEYSMEHLSDHMPRS